MKHKQKKVVALPRKSDQRSVSLPTLQLAVETAGADFSQGAASSKAAAMAPVQLKGQAPVSLPGSTDANTHPRAWDGLPAPALVQIGRSLSHHDAVMLRLVCKAWATHLGDVLTEAAPSPYPLVSHEAARKAGITFSMLLGPLTMLSYICIKVAYGKCWLDVCC